MLAERHIKSLKPTDKDQFVSDGNGLYLRVTKSGSKFFVYKDQRGGKTKWMSLGKYPDLSLLEARGKALEIKKGVTSITPVTVRQLYEQFLDYAEKEFRSPEEVKYKLGPNVADRIGHIRVSRVTRQMLSGLLDEVLQRGSRVMANRVLGLTKRMFEFAVGKGWIETNPADKITRKNTGGTEQSRSVTLDFEQIEQLFHLMHDSEVFSTRPGFRLVIYFCLLCGARRTESVWALRNSSLHLPETVAKTNSHRFPETRHVSAVVKLASRFSIPGPGHTSDLLARLNLGYTPHDLRRTFASRLADLGVLPHVIEKLLNHQMIGVMAVYNRAEYWPERMEAQEMWDKKLREIRKKVARERKLNLAIKSS